MVVRVDQCSTRLKKCLSPKIGHYADVTDRGRLLAGGLGQGDVEFEDFAVAVSVDRQLDLVLGYRNVFPDHLEDILLHPRQKVGAGRAAPFVGDDNLQPLFGQRGGIAIGFAKKV